MCGCPPGRNAHPPQALSMASRLFAFLLLAFLLLSGGCQSQTELLVGFAGQLTGSNSDLGVQGRNGAMLAAEELNAAGGVAGRRLKIVAVDDANTQPGAVKAAETLLKLNPAAVIGYMTSAQTMAALPVFEAQKTVLISPTTSTPALTGKKDHFFRVMPDSTSGAKDLARYAWQELGVSKVFVAGDAGNAAYVTPYNQTFTRAFADAGGTITGLQEFSSRTPPDWVVLAMQAVASGAQAVLINASARDVAEFAKARQITGVRLTILCPSWACTREILVSGGSSVEGIIFSSHFTDENNTPEYLSFKERYEKRFGWTPNHAAAFSHECVTVLAKALESTGGKRQGLEEALVATGHIRGVLGNFSLDEFGDVRREHLIVSIQGGRFRTLPSKGP